MREPLKNREYFEYALNETLEDIETLKGYIESKDERIKDWSRIYSRLCGQYIRAIFLKYSIGEDKSDIRPFAVNSIEAFIKSETDKDAVIEELSDYIGVYDECLNLVSFGILFEIDNKQIENLYNLIQKKGGDLLIDLLLKNSVSIAEGNKLVYPKVYSEALKVFDAKNENHIQLLQNYLNNWYHLMKKHEWYNSHKSSKINGSTEFCGYWSMEAASIAKILGIQIKQQNYLPLDLIK